MEWYDEINWRDGYRQVEINANWNTPEEGHEGYWDLTICCRDTGEDLYRLVSREEIRRLERRAQALANESWNDAYECAANWR